MIKITPYYEMPNNQMILEYYLNLVADVVPFLPEDVLDGIPEANDSASHEPRQRRGEYKKLLHRLGIPCNGSKKERRNRDAEMAERLIENYSSILHHKLYGEGHTRGPIKDRKFLREILTARFNQGNISDKLEVPDKKDGKEAEELRKYVFRYNAFSEKNEAGGRKRDIYQLLEMLGVLEVCPYCNRQFISIVKEKRVRPELDHFKSKSKYPYLAISINNLIPVCNTCNKLKRDIDDKIIYPYEEQFGENYIFRADCNQDDIVALHTGASTAIKKFKLTIEKKEDIADDEYSKRVHNSINVFALEELYQSHGSYVADLFRQRYILTDEYLEDLKKQFPQLFRSEREVKHLLRLMNYSLEEMGHRPLGKLTHDISEQIDELYKIHKKDE